MAKANDIWDSIALESARDGAAGLNPVLTPMHDKTTTCFPLRVAD
jgi:hypothetical protein